ncbi:glycosyltransferase family 2 protein [Sporomusa sphaeroides]|uniref:glycosyltransferase family 2 protein n=1 Tax=Sporomusa sphaeroides TaxID=47679 RepID=UPI003158A06C
MDKLVSIITPLYNSEKFVSGTIQSVQKQTYDNWEMIVVDDCSTDNGALVVGEYARQDKRIKLIRLSQNSGAAIARNTAIREATGSYIAFLDADDQWFENKLMYQLEFMSANGGCFSFTNYEQMTEDGALLDKVIQCPTVLTYHQQLSYNHVGCLTAIYDTEKLGKVYMPLIRKRQDYGLWLSILRKGVVGLGLQKCLARYRIRQDSLSANKLAMLRWNWLLYRNIEKLSILSSSYYLMQNIFAKIIR